MILGEHVDELGGRWTLLGRIGGLGQIIHVMHACKGEQSREMTEGAPDCRIQSINTTRHGNPVLAFTCTRCDVTTIP